MASISPIFCFICDPRLLQQKERLGLLSFPLAFEGSWIKCGRIYKLPLFTSRIWTRNWLLKLDVIILGLTIFRKKKDLHLHSLILSESFWRTASAKSIRVSRFQFLDFNAMFALAILIFGFQFLLAATKLIVTKLIVTGGHFQNLTAYEFSSNFQSLQPCKQCIQMLKSKEKLQSICKEALAF